MNSNYKPYTGIGSRETPQDILDAMLQISRTLDHMGYTLRSGGAPGADSAFESSTLRSEIFLPWKGFNGNKSLRYTIPPAAYKIAEDLHPNWYSCSLAAKNLHARNVQQVLGQSLKSPSCFVLFYAKEKNGIVQGGTATAVKLARLKGIPTFNLRAFVDPATEVLDALSLL
jgi:hypothetical protein